MNILNLREDFYLLFKFQTNIMKYNAPPSIILHKSKEVIFYVSNNYKNPININLWKKELNLLDYNGLIIHSRCIFNRLKNDDALLENKETNF